MNHIEFIGPPGSGKSTIQTALTNHSNWYHPNPEHAYRRQLLDTGDLKYRAVYRAMPSSLQSFFETEFLAYRYHREAFDKFMHRHPAAMQSLAAGIGSVEHQPIKLLRLVRETIERYQLGSVTVHDSEQLCLDESFAMRAVSILWRKPSDAFSLEKYLQQTPTPETLIYVDAPPEICLNRQRERGRLSISEPWSDEDIHETQAHFQNLCARVVDEQRSRTNVLEVENTGSFEDTIDHLINSLSEELPY